MRPVIAVLPLALFSLPVQGCSIVKALYIAVVHNSGAPPRAERDRIDVRADSFVRALSHTRVAVVPVAVLGRHVRTDTGAAAAVASALRSRGLRGVAGDTTPITLPFEPQPNEAAIFWSRFKALGAWVSERPRPDADYVMLVDVLGAPERGSIGAVHVMVVTAAGELAYHRMWNSHHAMFKTVQPHSMDDVSRLVVLDLTPSSGGGMGDGRR
jgi:hypothetical protein